MTTGTRVGSWRVAVAAACELAERPVWDVGSNSVLWVDVLGGSLHRSTPPLQRPGEWKDEAVAVGTSLGAAALRRDGGVIAAVDTTFVLLDRAGLPDGDPIPVDMPPGARFNDGACDPAGRFLAGTTSAGRPGTGLLWSLEAPGSVRVVAEAITESNGLDWSPDGHVMYYVDSGETAIRRYRYDPDSGDLGERLADLATIEAGAGTPDGLVVDADGAIWVALWEGAGLRRYAPDGELLQHIEVPVDLPTCPGFAGPALNLLVLTSAWEGLLPEERTTQPWAGHVLTASVTAYGRQPHRYAGTPR